MGTKVTPANITQINNSSGVATVNDNFDLVADEFDKVMYRDGSLTATGTMDMDSNRIINLPDATTDQEPVTRIQAIDFALDIFAGTTAYQTWLDAGNSGTKEDFFNYLASLDQDDGTWGAGDRIIDDGAWAA